MRQTSVDKAVDELWFADGGEQTWVDVGDALGFPETAVVPQTSAETLEHAATAEVG